MAQTDWSDSYLSAGSIYFSTNLANKVTSYIDLANRICLDLGAPLINLEIHGQQIYTNIARAVEMFSKFAGYTEEYLVFNSTLYERGKGLNLERLLSNTPELTATYSTSIQTASALTNTVPTVTSIAFPIDSDFEFIPVFEFDVSDTIIDPSEYNFTVILSDSNTQVTKLLSVATSGAVATVDNTEFGTVFTTDTEIFELSTVIDGNHVSIGVMLKDDKSGTITANRNATSINETTTQILTTYSPIIGSFDSLTREYRKIIDIWSFDESSNSSVNNLFTIEQSLAQQTYFSYAMGNYGFDLISWYILKQWMNVRRKMLAIDRTWTFNQRTQYMVMFPEPRDGEEFYGVVGAYVEQPISHMIKEPWVFQYALALTKIQIGRVRGKFGGTNLFGGGQLDTSLAQEGLEEKKYLEELLLTGTAGFGDAQPPMFIIGSLIGYLAPIAVLFNFL